MAGMHACMPIIDAFLETLMLDRNKLFKTLQPRCGISELKIPLWPYVWLQADGKSADSRLGDSPLATAVSRDRPIQEAFKLMRS